MVDAPWYRKMWPFKTVSLSDDLAVQNDQVRRVQIHHEPIGSSGIEVYAGYYQEEYLATLQDSDAADEFDKMRRSDAKVKMVLSAVKSPIKAATWEVEPADDSEPAKLHAAFIKHVLFSDMDKPFNEFISEALTAVEFGHAVFEVTHKVVLGNPEFGDYNGVRSLGWRSPKTIERWNLDAQTGKLASIDQYAYGDLQRSVTIPAQFLLVFTIDKEGDNYQGISMLRACYGAWKRKQTYLKLLAIGIEKAAIPTPIAKVPQGQEGGVQHDKLKEVLEKYVSHQSNYITIPSGWEIELIDNPFDAAKIKEAVLFEDDQIIDAFLANFLKLGGSGSSGSYALSFDQSDFFLGSIEHIADALADGLNQKLIPDLIEMKYGPQQKYPKVTVSGISDKLGSEFATMLHNFVTSRVIQPDDELESHVRSRMRLPKPAVNGQRLPAPQAIPPAVAMTETPSRDVRLAEVKVKTLIKENAEALLPYMQNGLREISRAYSKKIIGKWKRLPASRKLDAIKGVEFQGVADYQASLTELLAKIAGQGIASAKKDLPKFKNVKLSEHAVLLAEIDTLPPATQKRVKDQAALIAATQLADLDKAVKFRYQSSVSTTDSPSLLEQDLNEVSDQFIDGPSLTSGAGTITAGILNGAREDFFFNDDVVGGIESFTFVNGDPVSPICQDLAGRTASIDDVESRRFFAPLHHLCKSYIVPNEKGDPSNPEIDPEGFKPSSPDLEKYITLSEGRKIERK